MMKPRLIAAAVVTLGVCALFLWQLRTIKDPVQVNLRLHWHPQAQFLGYFAAREKGFFKDRGLAVNMVTDLGIGNSMAMVQSEKRTFATSQFMNVAQWLQERGGVRVVGFMNKGCNLSWIMPGKNHVDFIDQLHDSNLISWWGSEDIPVRYLFHRNGLTPQQSGRELYSKYPASVAPGTAILGMTYNQVLQYQATDSNLTVRSYCDLGVAVFEDVLVGWIPSSREDQAIQKNFVAAVMDGWEWTRKHPAEAVRLLTAIDPKLDPDFQARQLEVFLQGIPDRKTSLKSFRDRIDVVQDMMTSGILTRSVPLEMELMRLRSASGFTFLE